MYGKVLKISSNDLYGNVDDREVVVFAAFTHVKYMNKYIIFTFKDEYNKNILYYGSVHLKEKSLVIFSVPDHVKQYIIKFTADYLNGTLDPNEYEIMDISNIEKAELVTYSEEPCNRLLELDALSIKKELTNDLTLTKKKPVFLYLLLIFMFILLGGVTYIYLNPDIFTVELKQLECTMDKYNEHAEMNYTSNKTIKFDKEDNFISTDVIDSYKFNDLDTYLDFKNNGRQAQYFKIDGSYKYDDETHELKLIYKENSIIISYKEILNYLTNEGYTCQEGKYYE